MHFSEDGAAKFCKCITSQGQATDLDGEVIRFVPVFELGACVIVKRRKVAIFRTRCGKCQHLERGKKHGEWKCVPQGNYFHRYEVVDPEFGMFCEKFRPKSEGGQNDSAWLDDRVSHPSF